MLLAIAVLLFVIGLATAPVVAVCGLIGSMGGVVGAGIGIAIGLILEVIFSGQ